MSFLPVAVWQELVWANDGIAYSPTISIPQKAGLTEPIGATAN